MKKYNSSKIERNWQSVWDEEGIYKVKDKVKGKKNFYHLVMFPYPSGNLHIGHWYNFAPSDVFARFKKMKGFNVMSPIGFDAFGLPAENAAIKRGIHPKIWTYKNIKTMTDQLKQMGNIYDWSKRVITADPEYYKWTQWMFLQLYKNGLAYKKKAPANWCPNDKTVLANEQVVDGKCDRCGTEVIQKEIKQWLFKITDYAEKLLTDLDGLDWPEKTKIMQRNWIGKSEGTTVKFEIRNPKSETNSKFQILNFKQFIEVFTTRVDTIFGCTYVVLAPEHKLISSIRNQISNWEEVEKYVNQAKKKLERERMMDDKGKTGVELKGIKVINPFTGKEVPVFVADYVLGGYGTGAVMAVPAHDERDFEFAEKYGLEIKETIIPNRIDIKNPPVVGKKTVERRNVHALVRNPKNNKFLYLKSKKFHWNTFPMGGIDEGEDPVKAARREVEEETGYKNLKLVRVLGSEVRAEYFAKHKDENRVSYATAVLFDLIDDQKSDIDKEWADSHEILWIDENKISYDTMVHAEINDWVRRLKSDYDVFVEDGFTINSGEFTGMNSEEARQKMAKWLEEKKLGKKTINYKLRDWLVSRQRYWGSPIPIVYCKMCGEVAVSEKDLPVKLPDVKNYLPTEEGKSPLAHSEKFLKTKCPKCKGKATRETDTMDTFVCSSWYYLRYADNKNAKKFADAKKLKNWLPVNMYIGGAEHTVLHLLYSRFFTKALKDFGYLNFKEPFLALRHQGMILGPDNQKMSKSRGNVVDPDELVVKFGADAVRMYLCFMGPYDQGGSWNPTGILGIKRFLDRVIALSQNNSSVKEGWKTRDLIINQTIKKVGEDIENFRFNTAISQLMVTLKVLEEFPDKKAFEKFLILLAPFAPFLTEEIWRSTLKKKKSIHLEKWPKFNPKLLVDDKFRLVIQINGKVRDFVDTQKGISEDKAKELAFKSEKVKGFIGEGGIKKIIYVKDRLINIVV